MAGESAKSTTKKRKMGKKQLEFLKILEQSMGIITSACQKYGNMSRNTYYTWMKDYEGFAEAVENINEMRLDFAEGQLFQLISEGDTTSILFYLKCKGKKRGYTERQEIQHSGGIEIKVDWEE